MLRGVAIFLISTVAGAATYNLAWDIPSDSTGIDGYELHYGDAPGVYVGIVPVPGYETSEAAVTLPDEPQFIALRAVGGDNYSPFSNELLVGAARARAPVMSYLYFLADSPGTFIPLYSYDFETLDDAHNVASIPGPSGNAGSFNGIDSHIQVADMGIGGEHLTISAHINPDPAATTDARIISKATDTSEVGHWWMLSLYSNNTVRFRLKTNGATSTLVGADNALTPGAWNHVKATYNGAHMRLYVDGVEVGSLPKTGSIDTDASVPVMIGSQPQGYGPFLGGIDEVEIYDVVLP